MTGLELCPFSLPDGAVNKAVMSDCVRLPDHEGPHVVGLASNGWCLLYEVNLETRMLDRIVRAQIDDGEPSREQMAALLAILDAGRDKLANPDTPTR